MTGFVEISQEEMMAVDGGYGWVDLIRDIFIGVVVDQGTKLVTSGVETVKSFVDNACNKTSAPRGSTYIDTAYSRPEVYA